MSVPSHAWVHFLILFPQTLVLAADLDCSYNTRGILFCSWNADSQYNTAPCNVSAKAEDRRRDISGSCTLSLNENPRNCAVRLTYNGKYNDHPLTVGHYVNMTVDCSDAHTKKIVTCKRFLPYDHVRLDPPESLKIEMSKDGIWNLTWVIFLHHIFYTKTEVLYKPVRASWQEANNITLWEKELFVLLRGLQLDTSYEAKVRVKSRDGTEDPGAIWSHWSKSVEWRTPSEDSKMTSLIVAMVLVVVFIVVVIIFYQNRVKKIIWIGVPSPSSFFDPLMSEYKGNFQKWLSSPFPFSSFSPEPCPPDISSVAVNWNKEEHHPKSLFDYPHETQTAKSIHCGSSFSNRGYFTPNCFTYDHVDHQSFQTSTPHEPLSSPTEEMPLFHDDYLCAPFSIAGLGFHNKSFQLDSPKRNLQWPILVEEIIDNAENQDDCSSDLPSTEELIEESEDFIESPGASSTAALVFHDVQPASKLSDNSAGYLSLNELHQKHAGHWK
ncbi:interleukin-2 receptor subunit beta isoform X2 [Rana temporaria]|uniref:interleukin-2 receptor subunit beta isoform X2 n=1 Tax=Rana temporaria TaxID=8407 RepID=UPI001AADE0E7|nr:interleukin-2 receptor subunit beta isoform X2 [Rana temporaria]